WPRPHPGVSLSSPGQPIAAAFERSRHCGRGDDLCCGRAAPVTHPFQVESSRRAPLTAILGIGHGPEPSALPPQAREDRLERGDGVLLIALLQVEHELEAFLLLADK